MQYSKRDFLKLAGFSLVGINAASALRAEAGTIFPNPFLDRSTLKIKTFTGNYFEIGRQQGEIYRQNGMSFDKVKIDPEIYKNQLQVYEKHYPQLLEEFRGMAAGGNYDQNKLIGQFITAEVAWQSKTYGLPKACSIFGVKSNNGVYVGRNYDWAPIAKEVFEVYKVVNPERNSFIASTDMGAFSPVPFVAQSQYLYYYPDDAINNKGLFVGLTYAYADQLSYGISNLHIIKLITETCETVQDAVGVFEKVPLCFPKNFFIADRNGDMAVVEYAAKKFKVLYPQDHILIQTNHYVDPELKAEDSKFKKGNTFKRYDEICQKLKAARDNFGFEDVIKILGERGTQTCQDSFFTKTIWTLALDMTNQQYRIYWDLLGKRKNQELKI